MGVVSGTYTKYDAKGLREDLSDVIYRISPEDTPFMTRAGRGPKAKSTLTEWQTDTLAAADPTNAQLEGDDATFTTPSASVRVGNYQQILRKTLILSDTLEEVDKAGRKSEKAYQIAKRGAETKRDLESILLTNQAGDAGGVGTARKLASMGAWLKTNTSKGAGGGDPTYTSGVPAAVRTDGTQRDFTETILKAVLSSVWTQGGNADTIMVGPVNKARASGFTGVVTRNLNQTANKPTAIIGAADVYVSDFGELTIVPNRFQRERDAWVLDFDLVDLSYLRPYKVEDLAKTGDAEKSMMIAEVTLRVHQEAGLGLAADLNIT